MPTLECSGGLQPAGCKTPDGRLWFGTSKGLVVVDPLNGSKTNTLPPPVTIETLVGGWQTCRGEAIRRLATWKIPPGQQRLEFQYAALSYSRRKKSAFNTVSKVWKPNGWKREIEACRQIMITFRRANTFSTSLPATTTACGTGPALAIAFTVAAFLADVLVSRTELDGWL